MSWFRELSWLELLFAGLFIVLYLLYIVKVTRLAKFFKRSGYLLWVKFILRSAFFALLMVALLGPSFGGTRKEIKLVGKDIYLAIDLSNSMNATDLPPSRLQKVVLEMSNLVKSLNSDRIGLIIFSTDAFVQCPLTHDHEALLLFLQSLNTSLLSTGGTDIGAAIELGTKKLTSARKNRNDEFSKALVIVTDGEDFGDNTEKFAREMARQNISLFLVSAGTEKGGNIPTQRGFLRDKEGNTVLSQTNTEQLRDLARQTGGQYFEISDNRTETARLTKALNSLQGQLRATKTIDITDNKYMYPLLAALLLIAVDIMLTLTVIKV